MCVCPCNSTRPAGCAVAVGSRGLCPLGTTPLVPLGLKVQGSGSLIFLFLILPRLGCVSLGVPAVSLPARAEGDSPATVLWGSRGSTEAHPAAGLPPRAGRGALTGEGAGAVPQSPARPRKKHPGSGRVGSNTHVQESAVLANKSFWLQNLIQNVVRLEAKFNGSEVVLSSTDRFCV